MVNAARPCSISAINDGSPLGGSGGLLSYSTRWIAAASTRPRLLRPRALLNRQPSPSLLSSFRTSATETNGTFAQTSSSSSGETHGASADNIEPVSKGEPTGPAPAPAPVLVPAAPGAGFGVPQAASPAPAPKVPRNRPAKKPQPKALPRGNNLLVVGLGNPGERFKMTRHNIGFLVAEELAHRYGATFKIKSAFMGEYCSVSIKGKSVGILRPITFMNLSGQSARKVIEYFKLPINAALVLSDEIALDFGQLRVRSKGSPGGHNGLKSIEAQLKTKEYSRLKIGVGGASGQPLSDHVMGDFSKAEKKELDSLVTEACDAVEHWIEEEDIEKVMGRWNSRSR